MANTKSSLKRIRQNERQRVRNRMVRTRVRTTLKAARTAVGEGSGDARAAVLVAIRALDKAVSKGIVHRNTAARKKSGLARRLASPASAHRPGSPSLPSSVVAAAVSRSPASGP